MQRSEFRFTKLPDFIEARATIQWYAGIGHYKIEVSGFGPTEDEAASSAESLLGKARSALSTATIKSISSHRVPAASTMDATHERSSNRS